MKHIIFLLIICLSLAIVSADDVFQVGKTVDIKQSCYNNGTFCSNAAACNLTILYPNTTLLINNALMQNQGSFHNYTIIDTSNHPPGLYPYNIVCSDAGLSNFNNFEYTLTRTGTILETGQSIIYIFMLIVALFIFGLLTFAAMKIPIANHRNEQGYLVAVNWAKYLKFFAAMMSYMTLIWLTYMTYNIVLGYTDLYKVADYFYMIHRFLFIALMPLGLFFGLFIFIKFVTDKNLEKKIGKGFKVA